MNKNKSPKAVFFSPITFEITFRKSSAELCSLVSVHQPEEYNIFPHGKMQIANNLTGNSNIDYH